jgi:hypothetical protein
MTTSHEPIRGYTEAIRQEVGDWWEGRPLIGQDTDINHGVYAGTYSGEGITVDIQAYPEEYQMLEDKVESKLAEMSELGVGLPRNELLLQAIFETVKETYTYSEKGVNRIIEEYGASNPDIHRKIPLNAYIKEGIGVCRHQALTQAVLIEKYIHAGELRGKVSVERSAQYNPQNELEGHAWVRYTNSAGQVYIADTVQDYFGILTDRSLDGAGWNYLRPEEQAKARAERMLGEVAVA